MPLVSMKGITKVYADGTVALRGVTFELAEGEVHALLGENGAGKTTLMRILYGELRPTAGEIFVRGQSVAFRSPQEAMRRGIAMVHQNFSLVPSFTVADNLYLAVTSVKPMRRGEVEGRARELGARLGIEVPLEARVEQLSAGMKQRAEILKSLLLDAKIIILDEPTSLLTPLEARALLGLIKELKAQQVSFVYVTHKLREVKEVADRVTVLRKGANVGTFQVSEVSEAEMAKLMVGAEVERVRRSRSGAPGEVLLEVEDLAARDDMGVERLKGVTLSVRRGEVVGIAGVQGSGQKELAEILAGLRRPERGKVRLGGVDVTGRSPREMRRAGVLYSPESREEGLALEMSLVENSVLARQGEHASGVTMNWKSAEERARQIVERFRVVFTDLWERARNLSGGNQQRLMVGRELESEGLLLIAHEPTQGLDVVSAEKVRGEILRFRERGAVLLISSDLDEVLELSDRIVVLFEGRVVGELKGGESDLERLAKLMGGAL
ncbi:MAG: ABC transporter ATP-binding protein [Acidilobaceae archaeon]|nr:ABC transporter ATP-binding protein [Acidilobaceae archaeon]MCX8166100.1 ABC transporter ATP-binding protein [Acidilobaceae archaeon]MDW7974743.1 ABC transporter ATP-binding protein [Sulfolobales archaeon]